MHLTVRNHADKNGSFFGGPFPLALLGVKGFSRWSAAPLDSRVDSAAQLDCLGVPAPSVCSLCVLPGPVCLFLCRELHYQDKMCFCSSVRYKSSSVLPAWNPQTVFCFCFTGDSQCEVINVSDKFVSKTNLEPKHLFFDPFSPNV